MLKEGKIGVFEAVSLAAITISTKLLLTSPRAVAEAIGPTGWYFSIIAGSTALAGFFILYALMKRFPGKDITAVFEAVFGRVPGSIVSLFIALAIFFNAAVLTREFTEAVKVYHYPVTPPSFIILFLILAVMALLALGFEVIARCASLFAWPLLMALISLYLFSIPLFDFTHLYPILGHGLGKTFSLGLIRSSFYGEIFFLAVVVASLQGLEHFKKAGASAVIISALIVSTGLLVYHLVFPYWIALENTIPFSMISRDISYGRFFQRFEAIFLLIWSISVILMLGINLYIVNSIYCKVFRIDDHRPLIVSLAILLFTAAILPGDISVIAFQYVEEVRRLGWVFYFAIPLLALAVSVIRGKKGGPTGA